LLIAHCSLLIAHRSLLIAHCSSLIAHCSSLSIGFTAKEKQAGYGGKTKKKKVILFLKDVPHHLTFSPPAALNTNDRLIQTKHCDTNFYYIKKYL